MLPKELEDLLRAEQESNPFVPGEALEEYIRKIGQRAEILSHFENGCNGFIAYYCNDYAGKQAFITMVIVRPEERGKGIAKALLQSVLHIMRGRGFIQCALEVQKSNTNAFHLYPKLGFRLSGENERSAVLSLDLHPETA